MKRGNRSGDSGRGQGWDGEEASVVGQEQGQEADRPRKGLGDSKG